MKDLAANVPTYAYLLGGFVLSLSFGLLKLHAVLQANGLGGVQ